MARSGLSLATLGQLECRWSLPSWRPWRALLVLGWGCVPQGVVSQTAVMPDRAALKGQKPRKDVELQAS